MLRILIICLVLIAGIIVGPILVDHQGLVLFQFSGYRIKMSLFTFVIIELIFLLSLYIFYFIFIKIFYSKTALGRWLRSLSPKKSAKNIEQAQLFLLEGDYKKAVNLLAKSAKSATNPTLIYLQTAQAEIDSKQFNAAREHLHIAAKICQDKEKFAFKLVQLRLQVKTHQYDLAKTMIENLLEQKPRNVEVLRLADELYYQLKDYQSIIDILPAMYKAEAFSETELDQFKNVAYIARIKQLADNEGIDNMLKWWKVQPKIIRQNTLYQDTVKIYQNNFLSKN